jgi:hypothetical protein
MVANRYRKATAGYGVEKKSGQKTDFRQTRPLELPTELWQSGMHLVNNLFSGAVYGTRIVAELVDRRRRRH